jgi:transcriptional regulator with XRE-family HTH domain
MFGDELKRLRKQRKMSQIDLADRLNVSQSTITSWENGTRRPDIEMLPVIADLFGVTTDELYGIESGEGDKELWELREQVRRDPERHYLFSLAKDANIHDVRQAVAIIDALKKTRGGD